MNSPLRTREIPAASLMGSNGSGLGVDNHNSNLLLLKWQKRKKERKQGPLRVKLYNSLFIFKVSGFLVAIAEKDKLIPHVAPDKPLSVFQGRQMQLVSGLVDSLLKVNMACKGLEQT